MVGASGRLSLLSGAPCPPIDVAGAGRIYYHPEQAAEIFLDLCANASCPFFHQEGKNFDLFLISHNGETRLVSGPAWASPTSRGTGPGTTEITSIDARISNKHDIQCRFGADAAESTVIPANDGLYIGSFHAVGNGLASDTKRNRLLFSAYNKTMRPVRAEDTLLSWNYSTAAWTIANDTKINILVGLVGVMVDVSAHAAASTTNNAFVGTAIGIDANFPAQDSVTSIMQIPAASYMMFNARYCGYIGLGKRSVNWLVYGGGSGTQTFYGSNAENSAFKVGLIGQMLA